MVAVQFAEFVETLSDSLGLSEKELTAPMPPLEPTYARIYMRHALATLHQFRRDNRMVGYWIFWNWAFDRHLDRVEITSMREENA